MARMPRLMLAGAAASTAAFFALLGLAYYVHPAHILDVRALGGFLALQRDWLNPLMNSAAHAFNPAPFACMGAAAIAIAWRTRGARYGAAVAMLLLGANATTQLLKPALAHYRGVHDGISLAAAAFPSGHATASMSLAFAAVLIAPRAYRPVVALLGGLVTLAVSFSVLALEWHYPSDVVGGYLVATGWCCATLAALGYARARWPQHGTMRRAARDALATPLPQRALVWGAAIAATAVAAALVAGHAGKVVTFASHYTSFVVVATAIALAAAILLAAVAAALTGREG